MKRFEETMSIENVNLEELIDEKAPDSSLFIAKKRIYVPNKEIILLDQVSEQEYRFLMRAAKSKEG